MPKIHIFDSGIAARILRLNSHRFADLDATSQQRLGHVVKSFVVAESFKEESWLPQAVAIGHWRTHDGYEVDLVLERDDGAVIALEVKASNLVSKIDFRSLRKLRRTIG